MSALATRRYHEPGVGSRTGLRISDAPEDLQDFLAASKRQMDVRRRLMEEEEEEEEEDQDDQE